MEEEISPSNTNHFEKSSYLNQNFIESERVAALTNGIEQNVNYTYLMNNKVRCKGCCEAREEVARKQAFVLPVLRVIVTQT